MTSFAEENEGDREDDNDHQTANQRDHYIRLLVERHGVCVDDSDWFNRVWNKDTNIK